MVLVTWRRNSVVVHMFNVSGPECNTKHTRTHTQKHTHAQKHTIMDTHTGTHTHTHTRTHTHTQTHTHTYTHTRTLTYTYTHTAKHQIYLNLGTFYKKTNP
jgi:hypothetical protein